MKTAMVIDKETREDSGIEIKLKEIMKEEECKDSSQIDMNNHTVVVDEVTEITRRVNIIKEIMIWDEAVIEAEVVITTTTAMTQKDKEKNGKMIIILKNAAEVETVVVNVLKKNLQLKTQELSL